VNSTIKHNHMTLAKLDAFEVIADPSRRKILLLLTKNSYNINGLAEQFEMSRPAVSKHVSILSAAGFVKIKEVGRERQCTLDEKGFIEIRNWVSHFDTFWSSKLQNLETVLNKRRKL
jgi:DNA-binding transcriptional ArsR family regulator